MRRLALVPIAVAALTFSAAVAAVAVAAPHASVPKIGQLRFDVSLAGSGAWEQHSGKTGDVCVGWEDRVGKQTVSYAGSGTAMTVGDSPTGAQPKGRGTLKRTLKVNANPNESSWNPACGCVPPTAAPLPNGVKRNHDPIVCDEPLAPLPVIARCGKEPIKNVLVTYSPNSGEFEVSWGVRGRAFRNCAVPSGPPLLPVRIRLNPDDIPTPAGKSRKVIKLNPTFKPVPMQRDGVARVTKLHWSLSVTITRIR